MRTFLGGLVAALLVSACPSSTSPAQIGSTGGGSGGGATSGGSSGTSGGATTGTVDRGCGGVSEQGFCDGGVAIDCYQGDLEDGGTAIVGENCADFPSGTSVSCGVVEGDYLDFGVACLAATDTPCAFLNESNQLIITPCAGEGGLGCELTDVGSGSLCTSGFTPCSYLADGGLPAPYCVGDLLVVSCVYDQPTAFDCPSFAGSCSGTQCLGAAGAPCTVPEGGTLPTFGCQSSLSCISQEDGGSFCK